MFRAIVHSQERCGVSPHVQNGSAGVLAILSGPIPHLFVQISTRFDR